jgi:hypothetical protein
MLSLWFDAVFRGVREAGFRVEQGQFDRARMMTGGSWRKNSRACAPRCSIQCLT